jgi:lysophospholipase L1-like esterase
LLSKTWRMRILLIGDSHVRGMGGALELLNEEVATMTILVGRRTSIVRSAYEAKLVSAQRFSPEVVVLHSGHNDIVAHDYYNPTPTHILPYFDELQSFRRAIEWNHPSSRVFLSSLLPRTPSHGFSLVKKMAYNKLAIRYREMLRAHARDRSYNVLYSNVLWKSIRKCEEKDNYFLSDGLHLDVDGKADMAKEWLSVLLATSGQ